jgi:hypothetical protein
MLSNTYKGTTAIIEPVSYNGFQVVEESKQANTTTTIPTQAIPEE